jgi:replicative superfamily II helicase
MLRRLAFSPGGTIFFVVPFVALAEEKAEYLRYY